MTKNEIIELAERIAAGTASEQDVLRYNRMLNSFDQQLQGWDENTLGDKTQFKSALYKEILLRTGLKRKTYVMKWTRWSAAAAILVLLVSGAYYFFSTNQSKQSGKTRQISGMNDIPPGANRATLTLADGSVIQLDDAGTGNLANQGNTQIIKLDSGQLAYNTENSYEPIAIPQYNVITTPRGGQYSIVLPDGSKVWLNAASSLKFPTAFAGKERLVELMGEGYFEVAKNAAKPFKVQVNHTIVEAIGTAFNINAYNDEPTQNTTLIEGKVKLSSNAKEIMLSPGQQAVVKEGNAIQVNNITNMEEIIGWKDAWFHFDDMDVQSIMRQVSRWYDVDVKYEGSIQKRYTADIERGLPISSVLGLLEKTQTIKFKIDKRTITVAPVQ